MKTVFLVIIAILLHFCSTQKNVSSVLPDFSQAIELPELKENEKAITHFAYTLSYNETHEQANWVAYQLISSELDKNFKRTDKFIQDPLIKTGSATKADYKKSGYDRGHLAPAADMTWSETAMTESFYFSNMSPQLPGFNRGIWKILEEKVRKWAIEYDSIYITTGPIFISSDSTIGENKVTIPTHFYKSLLIYNDSIKESIAFILPHKKSKENIFKFAVSVDSLENFSGLNFFYSLPDKDEAKIEEKINLTFWSY